MIAIIGFRYRKYTHYTLYGSCPPIYGIAIIRSLLFLFLAHFHESANIWVAIKSGSTVSLHGSFILTYQKWHRSCVPMAWQLFPLCQGSST